VFCAESEESASRLQPRHRQPKRRQKKPARPDLNKTKEETIHSAKKSHQTSPQWKENDLVSEGNKTQNVVANPVPRFYQ
jgi:hypothetical protein